jgi:hypothetical protein
MSLFRIDVSKNKGGGGGVQGEWVYVCVVYVHPDTNFENVFLLEFADFLNRNQLLTHSKNNNDVIDRSSPEDDDGRPTAGAKRIRSTNDNYNNNDDNKNTIVSHASLGKSSITIRKRITTTTSTTTHSKLLVFGDFNFDLMDPKKWMVFRKTLCERMGFRLVNSREQPTRKQSSSLLDWCLE